MDKVLLGDLAALMGSEEGGESSSSEAGLPFSWIVNSRMLISKYQQFLAGSELECKLAAAITDYESSILSGYKMLQLLESIVTRFLRSDSEERLDVAQFPDAAQFERIVARIVETESSRVPDLDVFSGLNPLLSALLETRYEAFLASPVYKSLLELLARTPNTLESALDSCVGATLLRSYLTANNPGGMNNFLFIESYRELKWTERPTISFAQRFAQSLLRDYCQSGGKRFCPLLSPLGARLREELDRLEPQGEPREYADCVVELFEPCYAKTLQWLEKIYSVFQKTSFYSVFVASQTLLNSLFFQLRTLVIHDNNKSIPIIKLDLSPREASVAPPAPCLICWGRVTMEEGSSGAVMQSVGGVDFCSKLEAFEGGTDALRDMMPYFCLPSANEIVVQKKSIAKYQIPENCPLATQLYPIYLENGVCGIVVKEYKAWSGEVFLNDSAAEEAAALASDASHRPTESTSSRSLGSSMTTALKKLSGSFPRSFSVSEHTSTTASALKRSLTTVTAPTTTRKNLSKYYLYAYLPACSFFLMEGSSPASLREWYLRKPTLPPKSVPFKIPPAVKPHAFDSMSLLDSIGTRHLIALYCTLLCEGQVVLLSHQKSLLKEAIDVLVSLIRPLVWNHKIVPLLPVSSIESFPLAGGSSPFIIGICPEGQPPRMTQKSLASKYPFLESFIPSALVFHLDMDAIFEPLREPPTPPRRAARPPHDSRAELQKRSLPAVMDLFETFTLSLLNRYKEAVITREEKGTRSVYFHSYRILKSTSSDSRDFMTSFLSSYNLTTYLQELYRSPSPSPAPLPGRP